MKFLLSFLPVILFSFIANAANKLPVIVPYIVLDGPKNLQTIRVNLENFYDNDDKFARTEINFGDGVLSSKLDDYHTYQVPGTFNLIVKAWTKKNIFSSFSTQVYVNSDLKIIDSSAASPFNSSNMLPEKKYSFQVTAAQSLKPYKLIVTRTKTTSALQGAAINLLNLFNLKSELNTFNANFKLNNISIFQAADFNDATKTIEKLVSLSTSNIITADFSPLALNNVKIEVKEVELFRDITPPVVTTNLKNGAYTNQKTNYAYTKDDSRFITTINVDGVLQQSSAAQIPFSVEDGTHFVRYFSKDSFGNQSTEYQVNYAVDTVPPILISTAPNDQSTLYTNMLPFNYIFKAVYNEPLKSLTANGISNTAIQNQIQLQATAGGPQSVLLVATDLAGNITTSTSSVNVVYSTTPPSIILPNFDGIRIKSSTYNLTFSIASLLPTLATILVNGVQVATSDLKNVSYLLSNLKEGLNTISISVADAAGNISIPAVFSVTVDTQAPVISSLIPQNGEIFYTNKLPFNISLSAVFNEFIQSAKINGSVVLLSGPNSISAQIPIFNGGDSIIIIEAVDLAGNVATIQKHIIVNFSDKLPILTFNPNLDNILTNMPRINISGIADVLLQSVLVNGNPMNIGVDRRSFLGVFDAIQDGVYQLNVVATDIFGNETTTIKRVRVLVDLPQQLQGYLPTLQKTPTGYRIDYGPLFNGPDKDGICRALDQVFAAIPEAHAALDQIDHVKADIDKYKDYVPDIVTRNSPDTSGIKQFLGSVEEPLNRIKGAYLSVCKNVDILPALDCLGDRLLFKLIMGEFPEPLIIRKLTFIPIPVQEVLIPRTNICTGFDDSGLTCAEMVKLTPLIGQIFSPAVSAVMSSPIAQAVMDVLLCEDLCAAPAIKESPLLCKDIQVPGLPRIKKLPTRINFGGPGGGVSVDWGSTNNCGGFFNTCGSGGSSGGSCGWFESCGGVDSTGGINGRDFACSVFPSLWFCQSNNPVASTPPTPTTVVTIDSAPSCDPNIRLIDFINSNPQNATMAVTRYLASCLESPVPFMPDLKKPIIVVTSPEQNSQASTTTVRVTGYVDDVSSKVKIQGVYVSTIIGYNGIYFDSVISVPADGVIKVEAADASGNLAVPVLVRVLSSTLAVSKSIIASSRYHNCAITSSGTKCWGDNSSGQLGNGTTIYTESMVKVIGLPSTPSEITLGDDHSCALINNEVYCWGSNTVGQLGQSTRIPSQITTAVKVQNLPEKVQSISAGQGFTCALLLDGNVKCWGGMLFGGTLGNGVSEISSVPILVSHINNRATIIAAGLRSACALLITNEIFCWGDNYYGQLGTGDYNDASLPTAVVPNFTKKIVDISNDLEYGCAAESDSIKCWGQNYRGQLGMISENTVAPTIPVVGVNSSVTSIISGSQHSCAVLERSIYCWGNNNNGTNGTSNGAPGTLSVFDPYQIKGMTAGDNYSCVLDRSENVFCWGGTYGRIPQKVPDAP